MMEQQREIYKVAGVDDDAPAMDPRKRKAGDEEVGKRDIHRIWQEH